MSGVTAQAEARLSQLDRMLDSQQPSTQLGSDLFAVADVLDAEPRLRRAFTDPSRDLASKQPMLASLFGSRVGTGAMAVLLEAVTIRWSSGRALTDAIERQGVRAHLHAAHAAGGLTDVEEELFRVERLVSGSQELRSALSDRRAPAGSRETLVRSLVEGKTNPITVLLAQRAVKAHQRTCELTISHYVDLAAQLRHSKLARVRVATPLSAEQTARLKAALAARAGSPVDIQVQVDPNTIGGVHIRWGDEVIDGTVAGKLNDARRELG